VKLRFGFGAFKIKDNTFKNLIMCYWVGTKKVREEMLRRVQKHPEDQIAQLFYKTFIGHSDLPLREHYVAIGKSRPEITVLINDTRNGLQFRNMRWGLPWHYTDKSGKENAREMINSTCEKVFFVHKDIVFSKRCVIPLDGYYEFFHFAGEVYPHFLSPKEGLFYAGGVWDETVDSETGEITNNFSIITTPPNALTHRLHNNPKAPNGSRMLFLIPDRKVTEFLETDTDTSKLKSLFLPFDENKMEAWPIARFLRKEYAGRLESEDVRKKVDYPELFFA
jgi:putative SOS response-associated peptidase YedK